MKQILILIFSLVSFPSLVVAKQLQSLLSVPFKEVDYSVGAAKSFVYFDWVVVDRHFRKVAVSLETVEVVLRNGSVVYTTLDLIGVDALDPVDGYLKPEKVVVVVRHKDDLAAWENFLLRLKQEQKQERKKLLEPVRVLPPK